MKIQKFPNTDGDVYVDETDVATLDMKVRPPSTEGGGSVNLMRVVIQFKTAGVEPLTLIMRKAHADALVDAINAGGATVP